MGRRGPAPKPTAKKRVQGTYRKDRAASNEPTPGKGAQTPTVPGWLPERAKEIWRAEARARWELGVLTPIDVHAFARLCLYRMQFEEMTAKVELLGLVQKTESGYQQLSGYFTALKNLETMIVRLEREFGDTPSSRSRVSAIGTGEQEVDPFEAYLQSETVKRREKKAANG